MGGEGGEQKKGVGFKPVLQNVVFKNVFRNGGFGNATWAKKYSAGLSIQVHHLPGYLVSLPRHLCPPGSFISFFFVILGYFISF